MDNLLNVEWFLNIPSTRLMLKTLDNTKQSNIWILHKNVPACVAGGIAHRFRFDWSMDRLASCYWLLCSSMMGAIHRWWDQGTSSCASCFQTDLVFIMLACWDRTAPWWNNFFHEAWFVYWSALLPWPGVSICLLMLWSSRSDSHVIRHYNSHWTREK